MDFGIEDQYDFLLTLASHLNNNLDFELYASPYKPLFPGTTERPLTNPSGFNVQIAEFNEAAAAIVVGGMVKYIFAKNSPRSVFNGPNSSTCPKPRFQRVGPIIIRGNPPPNGRHCCCPSVVSFFAQSSSRARPAPPGHISSSSRRNLSSGHSR